MEFIQAKECFKQAIDNFDCVESMTMLAKVYDMCYKYIWLFI